MEKGTSNDEYLSAIENFKPLLENVFDSFNAASANLNRLFVSFVVVYGLIWVAISNHSSAPELLIPIVNTSVSKSQAFYLLSIAGFFIVLSYQYFIADLLSRYAVVCSSITSSRFGFSYSELMNVSLANVQFQSVKLLTASRIVSDSLLRPSLWLGYLSFLYFLWIRLMYLNKLSNRKDVGKLIRILHISEYRGTWTLVFLVWLAASAVPTLLFKYTVSQGLTTFPAEYYSSSIQVVNGWLPLIASIVYVFAFLTNPTLHLINLDILDSKSKTRANIDESEA